MSSQQGEAQLDKGASDRPFHREPPSDSVSLIPDSGGPNHLTADPVPAKSEEPHISLNVNPNTSYA